MSPDSSSTALVVLYYNKIRETADCLDSILRHHPRPETIFGYSNGSRPDFFEELKRRHPRIHHRSTETNRGFAGGFTGALEAVFREGFSGALFLTNDTRFTAGALAGILEAVRRHGAEMAAPRIDYSFRPGIHSLGGWFCRRTGTLHHHQDLEGPPRLCPQRDYIPGTALYISRDAFRDLGGTDPEYFMYWEDVDLSWRAFRAGMTLVRAPDCRLTHGVGKTCHKKSLYTTYYYQRNRIRFCRRFVSGKEGRNLLKRIHRELEHRARRLAESPSSGDRKKARYLEKILVEEVFSLSQRE